MEAPFSRRGNAQNGPTKYSHGRSPIGATMGTTGKRPLMWIDIGQQNPIEAQGVFQKGNTGDGPT